MSHWTRICAIVCSALLMNACLESRTNTVEVNAKAKESTNSVGTVVARFAPANSIIPFPNNLLFSGSDDGTLNIPFEETDSDASVKAALNGLDGFSTLAPMTVSFSADIDVASVGAGGSSLRVFEMSTVSGTITGVNSELKAGIDYVASPQQSNIAIVPLKPFKSQTTYLIVVTNGVTSGDKAVGADLTYALTKQSNSLIDENNKSKSSSLSDAQALSLEQVRLLVNGVEAAVHAYTITNDSGEERLDLDKSDIVLSWTFNTQSIGRVLDAVREKVQEDSIPTSVINPISVTKSPLTKSDVYVGTIEVPYYLSASATAQDTAALTGYWKDSSSGHVTAMSTVPSATGSETIPLLLSIPNADSASGGAKPAAGWPVVVFQHGITQNRTNMLAVVDSLADAGFAVVAIDLPLHGLIGNEVIGGALRAVSDAMGATERHFDLDFVTQAEDGSVTAQAPDSVVDSSGRHFINFNSLLTARDNVRQAVADLFSLTRAIPAMDYDTGGADFDGDKIYFVGHSLGAIVGGVFLAREENVRDAVLAMPGGGIAKLLDGSPVFGPEIAAGMAAQGVVKGTAEFESFMGAVQTVLDSGDPVNHANLIANGRGVLLFEVVGDETNLSDQVIPNVVTASGDTTASPTAGTTPLANYMGLSKYDDVAAGTDLKAWVRFSAGHHSSILLPTNAAGEADTVSATVTTQMQTAMVTFIATDGASLNIDNSTGVISEIQ